MAPGYEVRYDRRVSAEFLDLFLADGPLSRLRVIAHRAALPLDLQMRKNPKDGACWASLYAGLTTVLDVHLTKKGLRFKAHPTWSENSKFGFSALWRTPMSLERVSESWDEIELYLERVLPRAIQKHAMVEGVVQSVASKKTTDDWAILDREVTPSFLSAPYKEAALTEWRKPLLDVTVAAAAQLAKFPSGPTKFGTECDLLALDKSGRLLAIEVKPLGAGTIAWVPAQAAMYARVLQKWIDIDSQTATDGVTPHDVSAGTLAQRQALGHSAGSQTQLTEPLTVFPVVVLQRGSSAVRRDQMFMVRDLLVEGVKDVPPAEVYEVSALGDFTRIG